MTIHKGENLKLFISAIVLIFCTVLLIGTNERLERAKPDASDFHVIHHNLENETYQYDYTGNSIFPEVKRVVFGDILGNVTSVYENEILNVTYQNNTDIGTASIEVFLKNYNGSLLIEDAFIIQPPKVTGLQTFLLEDKSIELSWNSVKNVDGYLVYKKCKDIPDFHDFTIVTEIPKGEPLLYMDTELPLNTTFKYYVCAYKQQNNKRYISEPSEIIVQDTPRDRTELTKVLGVSYNQIQLEWKKVPKSTGYKIYRSTSPDSDFVCIAEIKNNSEITYLDKDCICGVEYFYYVSVGQFANGVEFYDNPSEIQSATPVPSDIRLSGTHESTQVTLSWETSLGAQGFEIYQSKNFSSNYELVADITESDILTWTNSQLDKYTSYTYQVRPYCIVKDQKVFGAYSNTYEKTPEIDYNYGGGNGADVLKQYVGRRYVWGGTSPVSGWDCSGFVQWTYKTHFDTDLPRTASMQSTVGEEVNLNNRSLWVPGDLIFYRRDNGQGIIGHVAVYLGDGMMIHALNENMGTIIQSVDFYETFDTNKIYCVRRVFETKVE